MYSKLQELLAAGKWKEANQETRTIMLEAAGQKKDDWGLDLEKVPDTVLYAIDDYWTKYSNNHFGFSVQRGIWEEYHSNNPQEYSFLTTIGWGYPYISDSYFSYERNPNRSQGKKLFSLQAPRGHLPMLREWDINSVDEHYHHLAGPAMEKNMFAFFARIPKKEE
jgi:hypothetical protein